MIKLYLDCDGVILDTIKRSYQMLKEKNLTTELEVREFYSNIDWKKLIKDSGEINGAINKIKKLLEYFDIEILTHVNSKEEAKIKVDYFREVLPNINVIPVPKIIKKSDFVDPTGCILVDDYSKNLDYWHQKRGISVKFSEVEETCPYIVISDLLELINLFAKNKIKVKE